MGYNFVTVLKFSLLNKIFNRRFWITNLIFGSVLLLLSLFGMLFFLGAFTSEDPSLNSDAFEVSLVCDSCDLVAVENYLNEVNQSLVSFGDASKTEDNIIYDIDNNQVTSNSELDFYQMDELMLVAGYVSAYNQNISPEVLQELNSGGDLTFAVNGDSSVGEGAKFAISYFVSIVAFFILSIVAQFLGTEIIEEKSSKAIDIIITNVEPKAHLFAKIISNLIFLIVQIIFIVVPLILGIVFAFVISAIGNIQTTTSFENIDITVIAGNNSMFIFAILTFILFLVCCSSYLVFVAIIASASQNSEEYKKQSIYATIFILIPYILGVFPIDETIKVVLSFVPVWSLFFAPASYSTGMISLMLYILIVCINILFLLIFTKYGARVYRQGLLNSQTNGLTKIITATFKR